MTVFNERYTAITMQIILVTFFENHFLPGTGTGGRQAESCHFIRLQKLYPFL